MVASAHHSSAQFANVVLTPRRDLSLGVREFGGQAVFVLEDELSSAFFRIGHAEYTFFSLLDGRTTVAEALGQTAAIQRENALSESDAATFCKWLVENGLASTSESRRAARVTQAAEDKRASERRSRFSLMSQRFPIGNPDAVVKAAAAVGGWFFTAPGILLWLIVTTIGLLNVVTGWDDITNAGSAIIDSDNWLWLLATTILLKVIHEFAHGAACRRFGAPVRQWGMMLILFVPLPWVDVTSAWRLPSKWQRIMISAAGMYVEVFIAALAAIFWHFSHDPLLRQHAVNVLVSAGFVTLAFNANPLMRFDGYFMLADWLEVPNLAGHGQTIVKQTARRWFLGLPATSPEWPEGRTGLIMFYGVAAFIWRISICAGLVLAADAMFLGAGVVLAVFAVAGWLVRPLFRLFQFVIFGSETEQPDRRRFALMTLTISAAAGVIAWLPWLGGVDAPAVVDYESETSVRSPVSGFVDEIHITCGQSVDTGDVLFALRNDELQQEHRQLLTEIKRSEQRLRTMSSEEALAAHDAESAKLHALRLRLQQVNSDRRQLTVTAPATGIILDPHPEKLQSAYIQRGQALASIGPRDGAKITVLIDQENHPAFLAQRGQPVHVHIRGGHQRWLEGRLSDLQPRAITSVPHLAFAATHGGPLPVVAADEQQDHDGSADSIRFQRPQFRGMVELPATDMTFLKPGMTGLIRIGSDGDSIGTTTVKSIRRWWTQRQAALQRRWSLH